MRGKLFHLRTPKIVIGITPADAGKTEISDGSLLDVEDHPRGCGENYTKTGDIMLTYGSPPRMRGKPVIAAATAAAARITPADAGKTRLRA